MKVTVKVSGTQAVRLQMQRLARAPFKALAQTAEDVEEIAEAGAAKHNKTGALVRSLYLRRIADGFEIGHDLQHAPHAVFVHWGTEPHVIRPRAGGVYKSYTKSDGRSTRTGVTKGGRERTMLRWPVAGGADGFAFAKKVHHPGYKGDPWLIRAAADAPRLFELHLQAYLAARK